MEKCILQGVVFEGRKAGGMTPEKEEFQRSASEGSAFKDMDFGQVVARIRPTAIVGAAAKRGSFSKPVIEALVQVLLPNNPKLLPKPYKVLDFIIPATLG